MSKTLFEAKLTTKNARAKLGKGAHWRAIDPDVHLGYRKGVRGGRWVVRWYQSNGVYEQDTFATADDHLPADGGNVLDFTQAAAKARELVTKSRTDKRTLEHGPLLTIADAVHEYISFREERAIAMGSRDKDARSRLTKHVTGSSLAMIPLHSLQNTDLRNWKGGLPTRLAHSTVRRLINDLKAALHRVSDQQGNRVPDCEDRCQARRGLPARRAQK